jgi:excisionase family DNA binding protein
MEATVKSQDRLLKAREVAERLGVTERCIYLWTSAGRLPAAVKIGGATRWRSSDIDKFIASGGKVAAAE